MVLVSVFLATVCIPFSALFVSNGTTSEQRVLAAFPKWNGTWDGTLAYQKGIDAYINDHFGFRERFLDLQGWLYYNLFKASSSSRVIAGTGNWLFYADDGSLDDLQGIVPASNALVSAWSKSVQQRGEWLAGKGIEYRVVIVPDKHTVYPEFLPDHLRIAVRSRLDGIMEGMSGSNNVVNLTQTLVSAKQRFGGNLYYHTDTHWTDLAAYLANNAIMASLGGKKSDDADLRFVKDANPKPRDLAIMSRINTWESNITVPSHEPKGCVPGQVLPPVGGDFSGVRDVSATLCPDKSKSVLIFHDSFMVSLAPYLTNEFRRSVLLWTNPNDDLFVRMVEQEKPDVVIEERVERYMQIPPATEAKFVAANINTPAIRNYTTALRKAHDNIYPIIQGYSVIHGNQVTVDGQQWADVNSEQGGVVEQATDVGGAIALSGWAGSTSGDRPAEYVIVAKGGLIFFAASVGLSRPDVANSLDTNQLDRSGFSFSLSKAMLSRSAGPIRLYAVTDRYVSELAMPPNVQAQLSQ